MKRFAAKEFFAAGENLKVTLCHLCESADPKTGAVDSRLLTQVVKKLHGTPDYDDTRFAQANQYLIDCGFLERAKELETRGVRRVYRLTTVGRDHALRRLDEAAGLAAIVAIGAGTTDDILQKVEMAVGAAYCFGCVVSKELRTADRYQEMLTIRFGLFPGQSRRILAGVLRSCLSDELAADMTWIIIGGCPEHAPHLNQLYSAIHHYRYMNRRMVELALEYNATADYLGKPGIR